jgi:hypothetical protein
MNPSNGRGQRVNVWLPEGLLDAVDAVCDEFSLARSRVIADVVARHLEGDDVEDAILDAIPDATLRLKEKERREREMLDRQKEREKQHSYEDRILGHYRKRIEGDAAYPPEGMRDLAQGYREDARIWHDDEAEAERKAALNDKWLSWYEAGYWARQHADEVETEVNSDDVSGWFAVGRDIYRLREHLDDVVSHIREVADGTSGWDADAVIDSVSSEWSVCRGAAHLLIESLTVEDSSIQEALAVGGETLRATEDLALEGDGPDADRELPEGDVEETVDDDREVEVIEAEAVDDDGDDDRPDAALVAEAADRLDAATVADADAVATALARERDVSEDLAERAVEEAVDGDDSDAVEATPDGGDRAGGYSPEDLAPEEAIETAVDVIEAGEEAPVLSTALRRVTSTENQRKAAVAAARERLADGDAATDGGTVDALAATDGGEARE